MKISRSLAIKAHNSWIVQVTTEQSSQDQCTSICFILPTFLYTDIKWKQSFFMFAKCSPDNTGVKPHEQGWCENTLAEADTEKALLSILCEEVQIKWSILMYVPYMYNTCTMYAVFPDSCTSNVVTSFMGYLVMSSQMGNFFFQSFSKNFPRNIHRSKHWFLINQKIKFFSKVEKVQFWFQKILFFPDKLKLSLEKLS